MSASGALPDPVPWLDDHEQTMWRGWIEATTRIGARIERDLRHDSALSADDYEVLAGLSETPEHQLRMADLAERTLQPASRLSQRIDRLSERGLVERRRCPDDGRGQFAVLTADGFAALEAAAPDHVASVRRHLFDHLEPADLDALAQIMPRLARATRSCPDSLDGGG